MASADAGASAAASNDLKKASYSTRVFKKSCPNGKITTYLGRRDFFDDGTKVDVIDGVVLVDPDYVGKTSSRKVYAQLQAAFRYGREELDVLGLMFKKELYQEYVQVYPPTNTKPEMTKLQERLIKKLGENAYPFQFQLKSGVASSVTLQPAAGESGKPCGVDYNLSTYVATKHDDKMEKRNSVRLAIKKLTVLKERPEKKQPYVELRKEYMFSSYPICVEARLDRELYRHLDDVSVHINIDNRSSKTVKAVKIEIKQYADICLASTMMYKCVVAALESEAGFPVNPSSHMSQSFTLCPRLEDNRDKRGLALDGQIKHEDTNIASSTPVPPNATAEDKENLGIVVEYKLKATLVVGRGSDIKFELPFRLTHDRPPEPVPSRKEPSTSHQAGDHTTEARTSSNAPAPVPALEPPPRGPDDGTGGNIYTPMPTAGTAQPAVAVDNLISFADETSAPTGAAAPAPTAAGSRDVNEYVDDDDIFFEEFVRLRMEADSEA